MSRLLYLSNEVHKMKTVTLTTRQVTVNNFEDEVQEVVILLTNFAYFVLAYSITHLS